MSLSPSRTPAPERERERARQAHQAAGFTLPPWIIQAITAAALPLWIWVISLRKGAEPKPDTLQGHTSSTP